MELTSFLDILWRRKWIIITTPCIVTTIAAIGTMMLPPTYRAVATLHMTTATRGSVDFVDYELKYADRLMNTLVDVATTGLVRQDLASELGVPVQELPMVRIETVANTELLRVIAESEDPSVAHTAATALADIIVDRGRLLSSKTELAREEALAHQLHELETEIGRTLEAIDKLNENTSIEERGVMLAELEAEKSLYTALTEMYNQAQIRESMLATTLSLISPPETPRLTVWSNPLLNLSLAGFVGLIAGLGLAFLIENLAMQTYVDRLDAVIRDLNSINGSSSTHRVILKEWTVPRLINHMQRETGIRISSGHMRVLLKELGYDHRELTVNNQFRPNSGNDEARLEEYLERNASVLGPPAEGSNFGRLNSERSSYIPSVYELYDLPSNDNTAYQDRPSDKRSGRTSSS